MADARRKDKPLSPSARMRLIQWLRDLYGEVEADYPPFLKTARKLLPNDADDARFPFIIRRLWMEWAGELPDDWKDRLPQEYKAFRDGYDWSVKGAPSWITTALVHRTLTLYQHRYPVRLTTADALGMIERVGSLHDVLEKSA